MGSSGLVMLSLPAHSGTHVDLVFPERRIAPERMIGPGKLIDVTNAVGDQVTLGDVEDHGPLQSGDFVFFRTDWSEFAGTERYWDHPELSPEVIEWLIRGKVNAVGIDALGLGLGGRHGELNKLLAENLANLCSVPQYAFTVYCLPLSLDGVDAIPTRVLVGIEAHGLPPGGAYGETEPVSEA